MILLTANYADLMLAGDWARARGGGSDERPPRCGQAAGSQAGARPLNYQIINCSNSLEEMMKPTSWQLIRLAPHWRYCGQNFSI